MEIKECRFEGSVLRYAVKGEGPVLLLLHGFCEDRSIWDHLLPLIGNDYRVFLPDLPGFGSSLLSQQVKLSIAHMAGSVNKMLEMEGIEKCVIIGHSMGGYVTLDLAARFPGKLWGIGLFHSSAIADDQEKKKNRLHAIRFIEDNGMDAYTKATAQNLFSPGPRNESRFTELYEMMRSCRPGIAMAATSAMMERPDRTELLKNAAFPVLFIAGRNDHLLPLDKLLCQAALPAVADIQILQHSAHMGMLEETGRSAHIINNFMQFAAR